MYSLAIEPEWTWSHFLFGLTYATVASLIFLFIVLLLFKPKIKIAPFFCKVIHQGTMFYMFKFVNISFFPAHDVKIELHKIRKMPMGNGKFNNERTKLTLVNGDVSHIPGRPPFWRNDPSSPHCLTVRSKEDLIEILSDEYNGLSIQVSLKHGLTGLSKVFDREYGDIGDVRNGRFRPGTKFAN